MTERGECALMKAAANGHWAAQLHAGSFGLYELKLDLRLIKRSRCRLVLKRPKQAKPLDLVIALASHTAFSPFQEVCEFLLEEGAKAFA